MKQRYNRNFQTLKSFDANSGLVVELPNRRTSLAVASISPRVDVVQMPETRWASCWYVRLVASAAPTTAAPSAPKHAFAQENETNSPEIATSNPAKCRIAPFLLFV